MSLLDSQTGPAWTVDVRCTVADYVSNYEAVDWLGSEQFAAIKQGSPGVEGRGAPIFCYGSGMVCWRHWAVARQSLQGNGCCGHFFGSYTK